MSQNGRPAAGHPGDPDQSSPAEEDRLRSMLDGHAAADPREALSLDIFRAEMDRLDRPFDQSADLTHITASAIVIGRRGLVLHRHRRLHRWMQPGGHVEVGEAPEVAATRETLEETGLAVAHPIGGPLLVHVDVHRAARDHVHLDLRYLVSAPDDDPVAGPDESPDVAWFPWDEAEGMADDSLSGGIRSARRLIAAGSARWCA